MLHYRFIIYIDIIIQAKLLMLVTLRDQYTYIIVLVIPSCPITEMVERLHSLPATQYPEHFEKVPAKPGFHPHRPPYWRKTHRYIHSACCVLKY